VEPQQQDKDVVIKIDEIFQDVSAGCDI